MKAGAFDSLYNRSELLVRVCKGSAIDILAMEREALGLYVSGHPLDEFDYNDGTLHIDEVSNLFIDSEFGTVGIICGISEHIDRNDGLMAFITIEDAEIRWNLPSSQAFTMAIWRMGI